MPKQVVVSESRPAIFTVNQAGYGQAHAYWTTPAGAFVRADTDNPPPVGSVIEIYATGLGETTPKVLEGDPSPVSPAKTVKEVTVTIGGIAAPVHFSGLTPAAIGLYQVNVTIPAVPAGDALPVVIAVGDQVSQSGVVIAVR